MVTTRRSRDIQDPEEISSTRKSSSHSPSKSAAAQRDSKSAAVQRDRSPSKSAAVQRDRSPSKFAAGQRDRSPSKSWIITRKRLRDHDPKLSHEPIDAQAPSEPPQDTLDHKRSRHTEWPSKPAADADEIRVCRKRPSKNSPSPRSKRHEKTGTKPSKFVEGSMNDRVSNKPPSLYTGEEDAMEEYLAQAHFAQPSENRKASVDGEDGDHDGGVEPSKSSSMSRFGRALVNALKPVSGWRGFGGVREVKEQSTNTEKSIMQARQLKAEKEYAELKRTAFIGTQVTFTAPAPMPVPAIRYEDTCEETRRDPHRDSGIDVDGYRSSSEQKRDPQVSKPAERLMPPQQIPDRAGSSLSQASSARKSSLHFRKPSLQTLKKVKSQIQLPSTHRAAEPGVCSSRDCDKSKGAGEIEKSPRKQPSRKDIAKQQRLSKKVSDLEIQLEIARRNLKFSMNNEAVDSSKSPHKGVSTSPQKGLKSFIPGALPSLPSERAIKGYFPQEDGQSDETESNQKLARSSGRGASKDPTAVEGGPVTLDPTAHLNEEWQGSASKQTRSKKRKSEDGEDEAHYNLIGHGDDEAGLDTAKKPRLKRSERQLKDMESIEKKQTKPVPRTPRNSPIKKEEPVPPLPPAMASLNSVIIDQAKILSMRSANNTKTPFGKHIEDIANLRKEFPTVTEAQWADYLGDLSKDSKMTDHTSISHHDQPVMSVLGPPRSASPVKAKAPMVSDQHPFSTPNQESPLRLLPRIEDEEEAETDAVAIFSTLKNDLVSERTSSLQSSQRVKSLEASKAITEKPLPSIQKEDYEWPEDVF